jgi:hypothetical protein
MLTNKVIHMKYFFSRLITISFLLVLSACAADNIDVDHSYPDKYGERVDKYGTLSGNRDGFTLFSNSPKKKQQQESASVGLGVNSYLWRATLDTINFMPIASADPFGGVIITDWYTPPSTPHERFKVNAFIMDRQLRADGIKVSIFRQEYNSHTGWRDVSSSQKAIIDLENTILTRARELNIQSK